jgi:hypothetical protein
MEELRGRTSPQNILFHVFDNELEILFMRGGDSCESSQDTSSSRRQENCKSD